MYRKIFVYVYIYMTLCKYKYRFINVRRGVYAKFKLKMFACHDYR